MSIPYNFDTERFILEVEARPAIWDLKAKAYSERDVKKNNWMELVDIFLSKTEATEDERNDFAKQLQKKWKGLRDSYNRERRQYMKSRSSATKKNQYIFFKQLSFLGPCMKSKVTSNSSEEVEEKDLQVETSTDDPPVFPPSGQTTSKEIGKRRKVEEVTKDVEEIVSVLKTGFKYREERSAMEEDGDRMFLLSLLHPIKELPENIKFKVKMEIMQAVERGHLMASGSSS